MVDYRGVQLIGDVTARTWLQLGEPARALQSAERASTAPTAASLKFAIARAYLHAGHIHHALDITTSALADVDTCTVMPNFVAGFDDKHV
ncbi:hypothetical protein DWV00_18535 [Trinickia dinghuensis]|uniref:Tetratricopeptide repeat protein n=1 Tax=Trinickia dinghuensis TaxID=2291023 RepID=A0A3D8JW15_9BURK|nr:hypothetical protein DWV00_18535 [Trinickia dinghuensis]